MVLVQLRKHCRDETLPECVIKRVVDHLRRYAKTGGAISIDGQARLKSFRLLVACHVAQFRQRLQLFDQSRRPRVQLFGVGVLEAVLKLRTADSIVHRDVLHRLHEQRNGLDFLELRLQTPDDVGSVRFAFVMRLEIDLHSAAVHGCVCSVDSNKGRKAFHIGILKDHAGQFLLAHCHGSEGNALFRFRNAQNGAGILYGEEAFRYVNVKVDRRGQCRKGNELRCHLMAQYKPQGLSICGDDQVEAAPRNAIEPALLGFPLVSKQFGTHHRRQCQRDDGRDENCQA